MRDCVVTPLPDQASKEVVVSEDNISKLDLAEENIAQASRGNYIENLSRKRLLHKQSSWHSSIDQTRSGKVFKPQRIKQKMLAKKYPGKPAKQLQEIRNLLRKDGSILQQ